MGRVWVICKKTFSISLVFNALLTIACCVGIIAGFFFYFPDWKPFSPYLLDGNVFWFVIAAAAINIFPSALLGRKLHTGRFLFHHYFYGFLVIVFAAIYVVLFSPVPLHALFFVNNTSAEVNVGRFFLLGGLALLLDDLPDVSKRVEASLNWLKGKADRAKRFIVVAQGVTGAFSLYVSVAVLVGMVFEPEWVTAANILLVATTLVTGVTSFIFVKRKVWHTIAPKH
ncbi:MAG: hypothetical protein NWE96_04210 [Candidatus Bathyarchaeota archaeon]|nr:hypothetical protein [Candidatus Bathyarchaeota archaeon]